MTKEVQMSIKMEPELRDQFMVVAAAMHRPAAQIVRDLMRFYIARQEVPNAITSNASEELEQGKGTRFASAASLFDDLGI